MADANGQLQGCNKASAPIDNIDKVCEKIQSNTWVAKGYSRKSQGGSYPPHWVYFKNVCLGLETPTKKEKWSKLNRDIT